MDQRCYIITIMAVFLALTVGIFIGNALLGNDLVIAQQQRVIEQLMENYYRLQEENRFLREERSIFQIWEDTNEGLEELILPLLAKGESAKGHLVIVNTSGKEVERDLTRFLQQCGFTVNGICTVAQDFTPEDEDLQEFVTGEKTAGIPGWEWQDLMDYLAGAVTGTRAPNFLTHLADKGYLDITGQFSAKIDVALLLVGEGSPGIDDLLIRTWRDEGVRVIVGARADEGSALGPYRQDGISTIGHINTTAGRLSLLYLLRSEEEGHFGLAKENDPLIPHDWLREQVEEN